MEYDRTSSEFGDRELGRTNPEFEPAWSTGWPLG